MLSCGDHAVDAQSAPAVFSHLFSCNEWILVSHPVVRRILYSRRSLADLALNIIERFDRLNEYECFSYDN